MSGTAQRPRATRGSTAYPSRMRQRSSSILMAWTYPDPDHSGDEDREITIGYSTAHVALFVSHCQRGNRVRIISAREATRREREQYEEGIGEGLDDDLRPEYDLSQLKGGVRGKYYRQAIASTNLVLIEPELAKVFPDAESVNRALRLLVDTAEAAAGVAPRGVPDKHSKRPVGKRGSSTAKR